MFFIYKFLLYEIEKQRKISSKSSAQCAAHPQLIGCQTSINKMNTI